MDVAAASFKIEILSISSALMVAKTLVLGLMLNPPPLPFDKSPPFITTPSITYKGCDALNEKDPTPLILICWLAPGWPVVATDCTPAAAPCNIWSIDP